MDPILRRKERVFYSDYADATFEFSNGELLKVNKALLAFESDVFGALFRESSPERNILITFSDQDNFKLFLDCLMGFKEFFISDALRIFPLAWNYRTEKLIEKCIYYLRPDSFNENVCLALNLALACECEDLKEEILWFFKDRLDYAQMLFHEEKYYFLLEPESVAQLLNNKLVRLDSYNFFSILKWGMNHITKNNISMDLKSFLLEKGIAKFFTAKCFETKGLFYEFYNSKLGRNYFDFSDYKFVSESGAFESGSSSWQNVIKGDVLVEKMLVKNVSFLKDYQTSIVVCRNVTVAYHLRDIFLQAEYLLKIPAPANKTIKVEEQRGILSTYPKNFNFAFNVPMNMNVVADVELEIKTKFYGNCRILKMTPLDFEPIEPTAENTYFTRSVSFKLKKKTFSTVM